MTREALARVAWGVLVFNVLWGLAWYGIKAALLRWFVGFSKDERRQAFSSRMDVPFDVPRSWRGTRNGGSASPT